MSRQVANKKARPNYDYFRVDYDAVRKTVEPLQSDSNLDTNICKPSEMWSNIKQTILNGRDKHIGFKKKSKNKSKWATNKVRKCRRVKKEAWLKYINSNKEDRLYQIYKTKLRNSVKENRKAKHTFEEKLADNIKQDSKSFYAYVNSKKRSNNKIGPLKNPQGKTIENNKETADTLNSYFSSVFTNEDILI